MLNSFYGKLRQQRQSINHNIMRLFLFVLICSLFGCGHNVAEGHNAVLINSPVKIKELRKKALSARIYCKQHKMDTSVAILIDMSIPSGLKRFVVWNFKKDTIVMKGMVSHGCGNKKWATDESSKHPVFSNVMDSHCSALGKYKIGARGYSQWGIHVNYLLYGLEKTNSNALARTIVLHSWNAIPDTETYPAGIAESWGCPAVPNDFMKALDLILKAKNKPVLLWIYN